MKKEIADLWADALDSGTFPQGRGCLKSVKRPFAGYCCLGVLCELFSKENPSVSWTETPYTLARDALEFLGDATYLPEPVRDWAGLNGRLGFRPNDKKSFPELNDTGTPFTEIAKIIRNEWEDL